MSRNCRFSDTLISGMFKNRLLLLCVMVIVPFDFCAQTPEIKAEFTYSPPTIDGGFTDAVWQSAVPVTLKENRSGKAVMDPLLTTTVMVCHDENNLYFAFKCNDPDIWTTFTQRDAHLWEEEAVEVFIDVDDVPDNYVDIEVSPANVLFDSYIIDPNHIDVPKTARLDLKGIRTAVQVQGTLNQRGDRDSGWTVEIALPFEDLLTERTKEITDRTAIKINFYRLDENNGMPRAAYSWSPTGSSFHKPSVFGKLILKPRSKD
ncbi:MAG: carbohydrate-binding family 9-like protein [Flavobacteriaceae bacterium]